MRVMDIYVNLEEKHEQSIVRVDHKLTYHCDVGGCCATVAVLVKFANNEIPRMDTFIYIFILRVFNFRNTSRRGIKKLYRFLHRPFIMFFLYPFFFILSEITFLLVF